MLSPVENEYRRRLLERTHHGEQVEQTEYANTNEEFNNIVDGLTLVLVDTITLPYSLGSDCEEGTLHCTFRLYEVNANNANDVLARASSADNLLTVLYNASSGLKLYKESALVGDIVQLSVDVQYCHSLGRDFSRPFGVLAGQTVEIKVQVVNTTDFTRLIFGQPVYKICRT